MSTRRGLVPIAIAALIALVYWPGLAGFWTRDDYMQLAFARLVGSPWPLFVHDHYFPAPGSIFRPLGFASFWLWHALFGTDYFANACGDLALHVAVALALYRLIRAGEVERAPAALCALLFALHPAVFGTALWWSARFDLLAMLFGLIAIRAALDHARQPRAGPLLLALAALLAALLSKETALAAAGAIGFVWLRSLRFDTELRGQMLRALAALVAVVVLFFVWRTAVLGTVTTALAGDASLVDVFGRGMLQWSSHFLGYATYSRSGIVIAIVALAYFLIELDYFFWPARRGRSNPGVLPAARVGLFVCGVSLFVLPAILQAPIAAMNAVPLHADMSAVEAAMQSRLYYCSIGGLAILLACGVARVWTSARVPRVVTIGALAASVAVFAWVSHGVVVAFAVTTAASRPIAEGVAAAVNRAAQGADAPCRIVVLGVEPPPEWSVYVSIDSIAKALSADPDRVGRCFIESDYATYFNLMRGDASPADAMPYTPRIANGRPLGWLHVGDVTAAYLDPPASADPGTLAGIVFLRYENGAFVDVTGDVMAGRLPVALR